MKRHLSILAILFMIPLASMAQDFHWSLIHLNPTYLNPAFTGFASKANRITGIYRDQWRSVPVPYSTTQLSYDRMLFNKNNWRMGAGVQMLYDRAGSGALSTFRPTLNIGLGRYFNNSKQLVQLGIQGSLPIKQLDFNKLTFDSQFDGISYDPNLSPQEQFNSNTGKYFDLGLGLNFSSELKKAGKIDIGASAFNLNAPKYTFLSGADASVGRRYMAYTKADIKLGATRWMFNPGFYYQNQNKAQETLIQSLFTVNLGSKLKDLEGVQMSFGPGYRVNDALIGYLGFKWQDLKVGFAFDGNTSDFRQATGGNGAYEIAVNYEFEKKKKPEPIPFEPVPEFTEEEPEPVDTVVPPVVVEPVKERVDTLEVLKKKMIQLETEVKLLLPVSLFFDNDQPNPRTRLTETSVSYEQTYRTYDSVKTKYGTEFDEFFEDKVEDGFNKLSSAMPKLLALLQNGKTITIEVKGFASPLASKEYNQALALRRISAIENYFKTWMNGALQPYLSSGTLIFDRKPLGEDAAIKGVSDDVKDKKNSVQSINAAFERRVELLIIGVK